MTRTARSAAVATLAALAAIAAIIAADFTPPAGAQSDDEATGRIVARLLDDGRIEFGWQPSGGSRILPTQRYFPADPGHNRWLRSSPVEIDDAASGRIEARLLEDGRIEFAFKPTYGERILTDARYFPSNARPNRWLRSTEITFWNGLIPFIAVSAGYGEHSCAQRKNGTIICWGQPNQAYRYGQNAYPGGSYLAVSVGFAHTCVIRDTGELHCWGRNDNGQTDAPTGTFTAISTFSGHNCAIRASDSEIECWGYNVSGQVDAPEGSYIAVSAGSGHTCAIAETFESTNATAGTGEIECWGWNEHGQATPPESRYTAVSAGYDHTCAIRASGEIECWGGDSYGQSDAPEGSFTAVSAGRDHTCAIHESDRAIECWGDNKHGQNDAPAGRYTVVSAAGGHTCAIHESGSLACWGNNITGQVSNAPIISFPEDARYAAP